MPVSENFQRPILSNLRDQVTITWSEFKQSLRDNYNQQITEWSDQFNQLPGSIRYPIAGFLLFSLLLTFILLLIFGIKDTLDFHTLSYSLYDPPTKQFVPYGCEQVPIHITGDYYADINGYWSGSLNYEYTKAVYYATLSNFADYSNGNLFFYAPIAFSMYSRIHLYSFTH